MKLKFNQKLSLVHIVHTTLVISIVLIINFFILRNIVSGKLAEALVVNSENNYIILEQELDRIETYSNFLAHFVSINPVNYNNLQLGKSEKFASIDSVFIQKNAEGKFQLEKDFSWKIIKNKDGLSNFYLFHFIDAEHHLLIRLAHNWIDLLLGDIHHDPNFQYVMMNQSKDIFYSTNPDLNEEDIDLIYTNIVLSNDTIQLNKTNRSDLRKFKLYGQKESKFAYSVLLQRIDVNFTTYFTSTFLQYLYRYPAYGFLEFFFLLVLLSWLIIGVNNRFTKPFTTIIENLKESKYLNLKNGSLLDEPKMIQRSLDMLHNQVGFYRKNMEKFSNDSKKIEKDIQIAKRLQRNILPKNIGEIYSRKEFEIHAVSEAAFELGGDLYDYFMLDENHLILVVADIAGKGIPASLFMVFTQTLLRAIARPELLSNEIAEKLNNKLIEENVSDLFVTMFIGILNINNGELNYCNAAHNLPVLIRQEGILEELTEVHGIPLGIYPDRNYQSSNIQLSKEDQIFIYTDGLVDSKDENGMSFSVDVLKFNLMGSWFLGPKEVVEKIDNSVQVFRGNKDPEDDTTLLALKYTFGE